MKQVYCMMMLFSIKYLTLSLVGLALVYNAPDVKSIYTGEQVAFQTADGFKIKGTLRKQKDCKALVLFLHGSGYLDRYETLLNGTQMFKTLAEASFREGFCTYQYDKRGFLNSQQFIAKTYRYENILDDADFVVKSLQKIGLNKIILVGHSEGTTLAIDLATKRNHKGIFKALILIGVMGEKPWDNLKYQWHVKNNKRVDEFKDFESNVKRSLDSDFIQGFPVGWWRYFINRKANGELVSDLKIRTCILHGKKDLYLPFDKNAEYIFSKIKNNNFKNKLFLFSDLEHGLSETFFGSLDQKAVDAYINCLRD